MADKKDFMAIAIQLAAENLNHKRGGPFGAVVVRNGKIIGQGVNTVISDNDPTAHAEVNAIRDACKHLNNFQLHNCEIYSSCEPCPMCLGAIYWARPSKIYYGAGKQDANHAGFDDASIYQEFAIPYETRKIPVHQMMREEAIEVFKKWIELDLKIEY
jgi:guanine deaminase